jgi:hypothetical protein
MPVSPTRAAPAARPVDAGGEDLTRRAVTAAAGLIVACCFAFSFGNVWTLARNRGVPASIAWLVAPTVDLSVVALVVGVRYLSLRGVPGRRLRPARAMLLGVGVATWALNTAESLARRAWGTAAFDSLAPLLLLGWAEIGPWFLRQFHAVSVTEATRAPTADTAPAPAPAPVGPGRGALPPEGPGRQAIGRRFDASGTGLVPVANGTAPTANGTRGTPGGTTPAGTSKRSGRGGTDDAAVRAHARRIYDAQPGISGTSLARAIGRSDGYGRRLVRQFRAQPAQASGPSLPGTGSGDADPLSAAPADTGAPITTPGADGRPEPGPGRALVPAVVPAAPPAGREDGQHA